MKYCFFLFSLCVLCDVKAQTISKASLLQRKWIHSQYYLEFLNDSACIFYPTSSGDTIHYRMNGDTVFFSYRVERHRSSEPSPLVFSGYLPFKVVQAAPGRLSLFSVPSKLPIEMSISLPGNQLNFSALAQQRPGRLAKLDLQMLTYITSGGTIVAPGVYSNTDTVWAVQRYSIDSKGSLTIEKGLRRKTVAGSMVSDSVQIEQKKKQKLSKQQLQTVNTYLQNCIWRWETHYPTYYNFLVTAGASFNGRRYLSTFSQVHFLEQQLFHYLSLLEQKE